MTLNFDIVDILKAIKTISTELLSNKFKSLLETFLFKKCFSVARLDFELLRILIVFVSLFCVFVFYSM